MNRSAQFDMYNQMPDLVSRLDSISGLITNSVGQYRSLADQLGMARVPDLSAPFADLYEHFNDLIPRIDIYREVSEKLAVANQLSGLLSERSVAALSMSVPDMHRVLPDLGRFESAAPTLLSSVGLQCLSALERAREKIPDLVRGFNFLQHSPYADSLPELVRASMASVESLGSFMFDSSMQYALESIGNVFSDAMRSFTNHALIQNQEAWGRVLTKLTDYLELYEAIADVYAEEDSIFDDDETVKRAELKSALAELSEELKGHIGTTAVTAVEIILARIARLDGTLLKKLVFIILLPLLLNVIASVIGNFITRTAEKPGQKPQKIVEKVLKKVKELNAPLAVTRNYRFVCVEVLNVRAGRSRRSRLIGKLYLGQLVEMVERKKSWTLVEWSDEENDLALEGWVFSRYLGRIDSGGCRR